ncbi:methyl-CpG-binding domain protein 5-like [Lissotriton helveticus]
MNGATESGGGDTEAGCQAIQVPVGWHRREAQNTVVYISPSGTTLTSLEQIRNYLLTDGTCKCGLECPLNIHKVFNFDPTVAVKQRSAEDLRAEEDMTKLCNHRRKIVAMATLYKSMEDSPLTLQNQATGCGSSQLYHAPGVMNRLQHSTAYSKPSPLDNDIFARLMMEKANTLSRPQCVERAPEQKQDPYPSCSGERYENFRHGQQPPYPRHHGGSFREAYPPRNPSSVPPNRNYDLFQRSESNFHPEYYSNTFPHHRNFNQSSDMQPSYSFPNQDVWDPSPKSVSVNSCNYGQGLVFSTSFSRPLEEQSHDAQNTMMCPEKDPLGILNSISNKTPMQRYPCMNAPSPLHAQVPVSNLNTPPESTSVSSCRSSPLVRVGHDSQKGSSLSRTNTLGSPSTTLSSISSPGGSIEPSPQRSRHSSASSEHGSFLLGAHYSSCSSSNVGRSVPRSPMPPGSPKLSIPQSPKAILEGLLHQGKMDPGSLISVSNALIHQSNNLPPVSFGAMHEKKNQPGFLGLPLGQLLNQQNTASFPASSLLSAAAKAQLASQKNVDGGGAQSDGQSTLQNRLANSNMLLSMMNTQGGVSLGDRLSAPPKDHTKRRRQRRSPTALRLIKESHLNHAGLEEASPKRTQTKTSQRSHVQLPAAKNNPRVPNIAAVTGVPRPPDVSPIKPEEELAKLKGNHPLATNQPLSSLLTLLSSQSGGNTNSHTANLSFTQPHSNGNVGASPTHLNSSTVPNLPFLPMPLGSTAEGTASQSTNSNPWPVFQDFNTQLLNLFGQLSSASSEQTSGSPSQLKFQLPPSLSTSSSIGSNAQGSATGASTHLAAGPKTASISSPAVSAGSENTGGLPCQLPTGDVFPFLNQDEVLSSANTSSFPNLLTQSFLASLPLSLALSQRQHLLNQTLLNLLSTSLVGQNDVALGLQSNTTSPAPQASLGELEAQALQSLLMASLLHNPSQPSLVPPLDFLQQQSQLLSALMSMPPLQDPLTSSSPDGVDRGETPMTGAMDDAFSAFPAADVLQSLLFPALSLPPALLALNSALLAASLGATDSGICQTQVSSLGSTSTTNTPTSATASSTEGKSAGCPTETSASFLQNAAAPGKFNPLIPPLINPMLCASLLGDLSALNTNASNSTLGSLQALLGTNPLLQNQQPLLPALQSPLGLQLFHGQSLLLGHLHSSNPLTYLLQNLQLNSSPGLEKQGHPSQQTEGTSASSSPSPSVSQHSSEQNLSEKNHPPTPAFSPFCTDASRKVQDLMSCLSHHNPSPTGNASSALDYSPASKPLDYSLPSHDSLNYAIDRTVGPVQLCDRGCLNTEEPIESENQSSEAVRPPSKKSRRSTEVGDTTEEMNGEMPDQTPPIEDRQPTPIIRPSENELHPQNALKHPNQGGHTRTEHARDWDTSKHFNGQVVSQYDRVTMCSRVENLSEPLPSAFWRCNREVSFQSSGGGSPDSKGGTAEGILDPFHPIESKMDLTDGVPSLSFLMDKTERNASQREAEATEVHTEKLKPSRRGRRKNTSIPRMSTRLDGPPSKWGNADPGNVSNTDRRSNTRQQGPGRPAKSCRRRII